MFILYPVTDLTRLAALIHWLSKWNRKL